MKLFFPSFIRSFSVFFRLFLSFPLSFSFSLSLSLSLFLSFSLSLSEEEEEAEEEERNGNYILMYINTNNTTI